MRRPERAESRLLAEGEAETLAMEASASVNSFVSLCLLALCLGVEREGERPRELRGFCGL